MTKVESSPRNMRSVPTPMYSPYKLEPWNEVTGELTFKGLSWPWKRSSCYAAAARLCTSTYVRIPYFARARESPIF